MPDVLVKVVPPRLRPVAKAVYAFVLPLVAQVVVAVTQGGLSVGNAIRSVAVAAVISFAVHQTPNK